MLEEELPDPEPQIRLATFDLLFSVAYRMRGAWPMRKTCCRELPFAGSKLATMRFARRARSWYSHLEYTS